MSHLRAPLRPIAPRFRRPVLALVHGLLPLLCRVRLFPWLPAGLAAIEVTGGERLARAYERFGAGDLRLILAFRHGEVDDPLCGLHLLSREVPRQGARLGLRVPRPVHAHFLFDRGMPLWGGRPLGWILSGLGGLSVRRGRHPDWWALRRARQLVCDGRFPFALAPEGATNGHGEVIGPLEPGVAQLGLWAVQDLRAAGRREEVVILPITIQYHYVRPDWPRLERLLASLEAAVGLDPPSLSTPAPAAGGDDPPSRLHPRLLRIGDALLDQLESAYARYRLSGDPPASGRVEGAGARADRPERLRRLLDRVLAVSESALGLGARGSAGERCRRLEEEAWRWIHREDLPPPALRSPLQRGLAERAAQEARLAEGHMRLAESFVAVSGTYVAERPSFERFMETSLLLHDGLARLRGTSLPARPRLGARRARVVVGEPLSVTDRWRQQSSDGEAGAPAPPGSVAGGRRRAERRLIADLTADLRRSFEDALL